VEANVAVPTSAAQAEGLYRQGNRVRIVGQIDCHRERQAGPSIVTKLAELDSEASGTRTTSEGFFPPRCRFFCPATALLRYSYPQSRMGRSARVFPLHPQSALLPPHRTAHRSV